MILDKGYVKDDCTHRYASVVLWGTMKILDDLEEKKYAMDMLLGGLEEDPGPLKERFVKNDKVFDTVTMLKLEIDEMTGKKGE